MEITPVILLITTISATAAAAIFYGKAVRERARAEAAEERMSEQLGDESRFKAMAADVLRQNSEELLRHNTGSLSALLEPLKQNLGDFRQSISDSYSREARERFALDDRIRQLLQLSRQVGDETRRLSDALKGNNKVQGDWGEMVLENLLLQSGLQPGRDFVLQESGVNEEGRRLRPDAIINLPDDRRIVIDSKVSIKAYFDLLQAGDAESISKARQALTASVKSHIAELKSKNYQDFTGKRQIDFVLMFIPHEGAYLAALDSEPQLNEMAFSNRVLPVSPTHLMAVISLIDQIWRRERQQQNAVEIARQAGLMLDKFEGFINDMRKIDRAMTASREAFDSAMNKLSEGNGNLIGRAAKLRQLGAG